MSYFQHVNQTGGIAGREVVLKCYDDGYQPTLSVQNTMRLVLEDQVFALFGYVGTPTDRDSGLVGREGVTLTALRPTGMGMFDGKRLDIIAEGEFIEEHTAVKVVEARGNRVIVRPS